MKFIFYNIIKILDNINLNYYLIGKLKYDGLQENKWRKKSKRIRNCVILQDNNNLDTINLFNTADCNKPH